MRRKGDLTTNKVIKSKARLHLHGGKQVYGMNYFKTYAPDVTWFAIRLCPKLFTGVEEHCSLVKGRSKLSKSDEK